MKHLAVILLLIFMHNTVFCQKKKKETDRYYLWDSEWKNVEEVKSATYFTRVRYINDTCWQHSNYKVGGPMVVMEQYKDPEGKIPHGRFAFMTPSGRIDSTGYIAAGVLNGTWYFFSDSSKMIMKKEYEFGKLISVWKAQEEEPSKATDDKDGEESMFPGANGAWVRYLIKNMKYPASAVSKKIQGQVIVGFAVDTLGQTTETLLVKSVEFSLDDEALRLINESPKWVPANKQGVEVKSYKMQPIEFRLQ